MSGFVGPELRLVVGLVAFVLLGAVASLHLRRTPDDVEYRLTAGQRRARSSPDGGYVGGNTDRLLAAQARRARRRERNLKIAGRRVADTSRPVPRRQPVWWRRTASRRH